MLAGFICKRETAKDRQSDRQTDRQTDRDMCAMIRLLPGTYPSNFSHFCSPVSFGLIFYRPLPTWITCGVNTGSDWNYGSMTFVSFLVNQTFVLRLIHPTLTVMWLPSMTYVTFLVNQTLLLWLIRPTLTVMWLQSMLLSWGTTVQTVVGTFSGKERMNKNQHCCYSGSVQ